jgi:hypothetical protein
MKWRQVNRPEGNYLFKKRENRVIHGGMRSSGNLNAVRKAMCEVTTEKRSSSFLLTALSPGQTPV